ncbi:MAG: hypothetical protein KKI09_12360 [Spirochaetes bacterium]|nr:hypothetical protein [Spirochaetota bacterium]MBU0956214.1 hypothetical protein [Spirochaetota bacterium]
MLKEFPSLRQHESGYRRLFFDDYFDLYVWFDKKGGIISGFQLVYDKVDNPHSLTWMVDEGYMHNKIDEGEKQGMGMKMTPILIPDGLFDSVSVAARLELTISSVDEDIRSLVLDRIHNFDNDKLRRTF